MRTIWHVAAELLLVRHAGAQEHDGQADVVRVLHLLAVQLLIALERHLAAQPALQSKTADRQQLHDFMLEALRSQVSPPWWPAPSSRANMCDRVFESSCSRWNHSAVNASRHRVHIRT